VTHPIPSVPFALAYSANGAHIIADCEDRKSRTIDAATGKVLSEEALKPAPKNPFPDGLSSSELAWSPDRKYLAAANLDTDVRIYAASSGELLRKHEEFTGAMFDVRFTPDGKHLLMAGLDRMVYVWSTATWKIERKLIGHGETITAMAVSADGHWLATGGFDPLGRRNPTKIVLWDFKSGKIVQTWPSPHRVQALAFSPDGKHLASGIDFLKQIELTSLA
jgi:WD40 repeat protein